MKGRERFLYLALIVFLTAALWYRLARDEDIFGKYHSLVSQQAEWIAEHCAAKAPGMVIEWRR